MKRFFITLFLAVLAGYFCLQAQITKVALVGISSCQDIDLTAMNGKVEEFHNFLVGDPYKVPMALEDLKKFIFGEFSESLPFELVSENTVITNIGYNTSKDIKGDLYKETELPRHYAARGYKAIEDLRSQKLLDLYNSSFASEHINGYMTAHLDFTFIPKKLVDGNGTAIMKCSSTISVFDKTGTSLIEITGIGQTESGNTINVVNGRIEAGVITVSQGMKECLTNVIEDLRVNAPKTFAKIAKQVNKPTK